MASPGGVTIGDHVAGRAETRPAQWSHQVGLSGQCRPRPPFAGAPRRIGSRLRGSTAPSKQPFRRAKAQRASVIGGKPCSHPRVRSFSAASTARRVASSTVGWSSGRTVKPDFPAALGEEFRRGAETLRVRPCRGRGHPGSHFHGAEASRLGLPIQPSRQATFRVRWSPVREARRIPTRRTTIGPTASAFTRVPASAPRPLGWDGRSSKDHRASCRLAVPVSSAQNALVTDFAFCARNPGRYTKRRSAWIKRPFRRCRSVGAWEKRSPQRRSAVDTRLAVGTYVAAVRVEIGQKTGKIQI